MRIGLDFDNTIIRYDDVFATAAKARGLLGAEFSGTKQQVRDAIRLLPNGEIEWQKLQGYVYGAGIGGAEPFPGLESFLLRARKEGAHVLIVSHKTIYGHFDPERVNLREAALGWLEARGYFSAGRYGLRREDVYFGETRAEKLARIAEVSPDLFIDDLEEVLDDPDFPSGVRRLLFSENPPEGAPYPAYPNWRAIEGSLFDVNA